MNLRSRNKVEVGFSMSSMTDVVFLLLIFFIMASTLISPKGLAVNLPGGESRTPEKPKLVISALNEKTIQFMEKSYTLDQLDIALKEERINHGERAVLKFDGDKEISWGLAAEIMDIAKRNDYVFVVGLKN